MWPLARGGIIFLLRSGAGSDGNVYNVLRGLSDFWRPSGASRPSCASSGWALGAVRSLPQNLRPIPKSVRRAVGDQNALLGARLVSE